VKRTSVDRSLRERNVNSQSELPTFSRSSACQAIHRCERRTSYHVGYLFVALVVTDVLNLPEGPFTVA
jgi:hypothetical protein